mmetsp:Transcript_88752/g.202999  ORF Transcript_88752/g.202999 Transcript_88752/m.202999 type:complete len:220 (+) Transcript_88752:1-660(+)
MSMNQPASGRDLGTPAPQTSRTPDRFSSPCSTRRASSLGPGVGLARIRQIESELEVNSPSPLGVSELPCHEPGQRRVRSASPCSPPRPRRLIPEMETGNQPLVDAGRENAGSPTEVDHAVAAAAAARAAAQYRYQAAWQDAYFRDYLLVRPVHRSIQRSIIQEQSRQQILKDQLRGEAVRLLLEFRTMTVEVASRQAHVAQLNTSFLQLETMLGASARC